jgi:uncharacterized protein
MNGEIIIPVSDLQVSQPQQGERGPLPKIVPFREFGIKVQGSCDFGCNCYMYQGANAPLRRTYAPVPLETVEQTGFRIGEHAQAHDIPEVDIVLHGGEPLLNINHAVQVTRLLRRKLGDLGITATVRAQSNLSNLATDTKKKLDVLRAEGIRIGASLDGGADAQNHSRPRLNGDPSYDRIKPVLETLRDEYPDIFDRILCTIYLEHDPNEAYEAGLEFIPNGPPEESRKKFTFNFLLPHATWDNPPPGKTEDIHATPYAEWLKPLAWRWAASTDSQRFNVPLFRDIQLGYHGMPPTYDAFGAVVGGFAFVEHNRRTNEGRIKYTDALKIIGGDADDTGMNVAAHSFDDVLASMAESAGGLALSAICQSNACGVRDTCRGGRPTHRYSSGRGFDNVSVYCDDLKELIRYYHEELRRGGVLPRPLAKL